MDDKRKICMVACLESGLDILKYLNENDINISHLITITPEQAKKYNVSGYIDYTDYCKKNGISIYNVCKYSLKDKRDLEFFLANQFDLLLIGGWTRLIPEAILDSLKVGGIGVHGSPEFLPVGRGRSPMNWAIIHGKKRFIMHLFKLTAGIDDGDIFATNQFEITKYDTIKTLYLKYSIVVKRMLAENIPKVLSNQIIPIPQTGEAEYFPKRIPQDGLIKWNKLNIDEIYNFIRAQTKPYPGAFGNISGQKMTLWDSKPFDRIIDYRSAEYGQIVEVFDDCFLVNCRGGILIVKEYDCSFEIERGMVFDYNT